MLEHKLYDSSREREIPVISYDTLNTNPTISKKTAIINHGYEVLNSKYEFLSEELIRLGYFVISIQHDLPSDKKMPMVGDLYKQRLPIWDRNIENINFVINHFKAQKPHLNFEELVLIGHSNGGDTIMHYIQKYPENVSKAISLDSRRVPIPRISSPKILSIRANDSTPEPHILPSISEQKIHNIRIINLEAKHNDMSDYGSKKIKEEIIDCIYMFLEF